MEILTKKQVLKNRLLEFVKTTLDSPYVFSITTDINRGYWVYKGVIYHNDSYNLKAAKKAKTSQLDKNTVYYITTITDTRLNLFNI